MLDGSREILVIGIEYGAITGIVISVIVLMQWKSNTTKKKVYKFSATLLHLACDLHNICLSKAQKVDKS